MVLAISLSVPFLIGLGSREPADWSMVNEKIARDFPQVEQLSVAALSAWLASGEEPPLLLDVREEPEYRVSHLRGALRVDPHDPHPVLPEGVGKETPIVAYCSVGHRSSALVARLVELGYRRVANLEGSIFAWANAGYPVVRGREEVRQVHPFDEHWGSLLAAELRAYSPE